MERILLDNLAANMGFDDALKRAPGVDALVSRYAAAVMFDANAARRTKVIDEVQQTLIRHFAGTVQPAAQKLGIANARRVLSGLQGVPRDLGDAGLRRLVLLDLKARPAQRLRIVQALVDDKANTLENRLTAYWLEPGQSDREKVEQLRRLHFGMEKQRKEYDAKMIAFREGELDTRPKKPKLDFYSRFTEDVKQDFREQARRTGTDAETAHFVREGYTELAWVTVNAMDACPDCRKRQGVKGDMRFWDKVGRPGEGKTVCGAACFCMLVPAATLTRHPSLAEGLIAKVDGVYTDKKTAKMFDANRN